MTKRLCFTWSPGGCLLVLVLCSCRSVVPPGAMGVATIDRALAEKPETVRAQGASSEPDNEAAAQVSDEHIKQAISRSPHMPVIPTAPMGIPLPQTIATPWAPPGIELPWPADEYLWDGGEHAPVVVVDQEIRGLELEDTVIHYDTIDGRTIVEPSNRVALYAPRFAAVRQVYAPLQNKQEEGLVQVDLPLRLLQQTEDQLADAALQPVQPVGGIGTKRIAIERLKQAEGKVAITQAAEEVSDRLLPYEDFLVMRIGSFAQSEKARLVESIEAAIVWSHDTALQVILDRTQAVVETGDQRAQATFTIDVPNNPRLRVLKVASSNMARPGDFVDFTIRFDNIGDQAIGNVTLVDNLTTRLEYVPDTARSSLDAEFFTQANEGDSVLLRWEFSEPLPAGQGGLVRFRCRVR